MARKERCDTISFRPSDWQRTIIEKRAELSGQYKKDFIAKSCVYSNIVVVGTKENIKRIVDTAQEMQEVMREIARQILSSDFSLSEETYKELKDDYLAFAITMVDILNGAAYLFDKTSELDNQHWKYELEEEKYKAVLKLDADSKID